MRKGLCIMVLLLTLLGTAPSFAAMTLHVTSDSDGVFILDGDNVKGVEAVDITINYDANALADPHVEIQGGTLTDVFERSPGVLLVSIFRPDPDMMFQIWLTFRKKGNAPGGLSDVTTSVTDTAGESYQASANIFHLTPFQPAAVPEVEDTADISTGGKDEMAREDGTVHRRNRKKSVMQRFEEFAGEKGLKEFTALFERYDRDLIELTCIGNGQCRISYGGRDMVEIEQEPAIALSDGEMPIVVRLEMKAEEGRSPDFTLSSAKLISLLKAGEKSWIITTVPNKGTWQAGLIVRTGKETIEFPLVVAPPVKVQTGITEKDFLVALDKYLSDQAAGHLAEGRPFRQFLHEYIFTANYLAQGVATVVKQTEQRKTEAF